MNENGATPSEVGLGRLDCSGRADHLQLSPSSVISQHTQEIDQRPCGDIYIINTGIYQRLCLDRLDTHV